MESFGEVESGVATHHRSGGVPSVEGDTVRPCGPKVALSN